jgi:hypothetical protein
LPGSIQPSHASGLARRAAERQFTGGALAGGAGNANSFGVMMRTLLAGLVLACGCALAGCNGGGRQSTTGAIEVGQCHVGGCSGELCSSQEALSSPCIFRPEFACYGSTPGVCEPQRNGDCGWTQTPELLMCLSNASP